MVLFLLGPYLWTCWCALQSPSCAGGLLQFTIVMADCRRGLRVAVARVQIDVRIRCLSGFSRDHTAGVAWAIVGTHAYTRIRARPAWMGGSIFFGSIFLHARGRSSLTPELTPEFLGTCLHCI